MARVGGRCDVEFEALGAGADAADVEAYAAGAGWLALVTLVFVSLLLHDVELVDIFRGWYVGHGASQ